MIISVNKAILHVCCVTSGEKFMSNTELDLTEPNIPEYVRDLVPKAMDSPAKIKGQFRSNSGCQGIVKEYALNKTQFAEMSKQIAERIYSGVESSDKQHDTDVLIAEITMNGEADRYIVVLKLDNKDGFRHALTLSKDGESVNTSIEYCTSSILPKSTQTVNEFAIINLKSLEIGYAGKMYKVDGERVDLMRDVVLECEPVTMSSKQADTEIKKLIKSVSNDAFESTVDFKETLTELVSEQVNEPVKTYDLETVASNIFKTYGEKKQFLDMAKERGLIASDSDKLPLDAYTVKKLNEKVKVVTDNGYEIRFPHQLRDRIEFMHEDDGSMSIKLKGINEVTMK